MIIDLADTRKHLILTLLFAFFLFVFFYFLNDLSMKESFQNKPLNISDNLLINENLKLNSISSYNNKEWWNHHTVNNGVPVTMKWNELDWKGHSSLNNSKNTNFTMSFFIYVHENSLNGQPIFRIVDSGSGFHTDRSPGIFLAHHEDTPYLSIRGKSKKNTNDGKERLSEQSDNIIPLKKTTFVTIVFNRNGYKLYIDGNYKSFYNWKLFDIQNPENAFIEFGVSNNSTSFFIRNVSMNENTLNAKYIQQTYQKNKIQLGNSSPIIQQ
jgi:hypothetical protein